MRWIVKLRNAKNAIRYYDVDTSSEVNAVAKALEANPDWWVVKSWPVSDAEQARIIGDEAARQPKPRDGDYYLNHWKPGWKERNGY